MKINKKINQLLAIGLGCGILMSFVASELSVQAAQIEVDTTVHNECSMLQEEQVYEICNSVVENITEKYAGVYSFDNIDVTLYNEFEENGKIVVDVEVLTDMTLTRDPQDSPYVQGMELEIQAMTDVEEKGLAVLALDAYLQNAKQYYNVPILTGFCYRVYIPMIVTASGTASTEYSIYHRVDAEDGVILTEMKEDERFTEVKDAEDGREYINNVLIEELNLASVNAVTYNASDAVEYAVEHATDVPEYSTENGNGSDCANFVSKCINAGGIPQDTSGGYSKGWYPGALNWIRTGYNGTDGVVIYMTDKGYFASVSSSADATEGSIMYYNTKSHVALVTLIDGSTIKYSHHSSVAKTSVYYVYDSSKDDVTFYVPQV